MNNHREDLMRLPAQIDRLQELVASFYQLGFSLDLHEVLHTTMVTATRLMNAEGGSIALIDEESTHLRFVEVSNTGAKELLQLRVPLGEGICGHVAQTGRSVRVIDAEQDERFYDGVDRKLGNQTRSYLCVPLICDGQVIGTAQVLNRLDGSSFTEDDELLLEGFARQAALAIKNARLHEFELLQQALKSELEVCASIQRNLFPQSRPSLEGYEVYGASLPCREVGGDYFTFVDRHDGSCDVTLADVSGKGLPASLIVSDVHSGLHLLAQLDESFGSVATQLNRHLVKSLLSNKFVTLAGMRLRPKCDDVEYVVAGHSPPFVVRSNGEVEQLELSGPLLGVLEAEYESPTVALHSGDLLVTYTDGYSEAENPEGEMLGDERIAAAVAQWAGRPLAEIAERLDRMTEEYRQGAPAQDDLTLLLVRRTRDGS